MYFSNQDSGTITFEPNMTDWPNCSSTTITSTQRINIVLGGSQGIRTFAINVGTVSYTLTIDLNNNATGTIAPVTAPVTFPKGNTGTPDGIIRCGQFITTQPPNASINLVTIGQQTYELHLFMCANQDISALGAFVIFSKPLQSVISVDGDEITLGTPNTALAFCPCDCSESCDSPNGNVDCPNVPVPQLNLIAQTTLNGQNVGEVDFVIRDTINYHKEKLPKCENTCRPRYAPKEDVIASCFTLCCPDIQAVVKGEGCSLRQKATRLYSSDLNIDFDTFYNRLVAYPKGTFMVCSVKVGIITSSYW